MVAKAHIPKKYVFQACFAEQSLLGYYISLHPITPVAYPKHEHGISPNTSITTNLGFQMPNHLKPQPVIPPNGRTSQPSWIGLHPSYSMDPECLFQPGLQVIVTQPQILQGFQRVFPTRASRTSNSNHLGLLKHFSSQGF